MTFLRRNSSYNYMQSSTPIRLITAASFAFSALLSAQTAPAPQAKPAGAVQTLSTLPATALTTAPTPPPTPATPLTPSQEQPKHAQVTLANGILSVTADNSSLNQILRQISRETGIKITGGVMDERVFGHYGPAAPDQVLADLLDGTGSNMLLVARDGTTPAELILTPRQGGPTPPNPNAQTFDDKSDTEQAQPAPEPPPPSTFEAPSARNKTAPPITPATPDSATPADASQPDSPNGVKTPQQIYEQLQRLRQPAPPQ
ncbi:hypothetical protein [Tunturiibacter gelidoferens]|uniref:Uncharacterized protein n=1 Tax=Tunturiibacter gelidiferens TaxID=3069689 RepID=A0ACC5NY70_9BACT|nr:hypothetical protein [Edaphobacter lichenicola]MBB5339395.1 hypothetical protein [Edaphobacter lichenicola]